MHSLNYISTIIKYAPYILCIDRCSKMWITKVTVVFICLSTYFLLKQKQTQS